MIGLSQGTGYAVLAMGFIASAAGKPLLVRTIAESCDLPAPFLSKVVNRLAHGGLVNTQRGVNGGVTLARPAHEITLLEVCRTLDDPILQPRCALGVAECSDARACPAHAFAKETRNRITAFLANTTIADIAAFEAKRRWGANSPDAVTINGASQATINGASLPPREA